MIIRFFLATLFVLLASIPVNAGDTDYLALLAEDSEIKAIAEVVSIKVVSNNSDGTFKQVTFKKLYGVTPFIPQEFVGGCKTMEARWQRRLPDTVYFNPRRGQKVYVTVTTNEGAITSYTLLTRQLEAALKQNPRSVAYSKGRANVLPQDQ
ncbi:hypothetical protein [Pseudodesulfovibrio piezophilus]|nr:hypothetical protein [Pseudodesulfovibrio piezophilus]